MLFRSNKFPPEILATIFDHVRCGTTDTRASDNKNAALDVRSLITVTHVCRPWRTLALDTASLWTHVAAYSSSTPAFVERARGARIDEVSAAVLNGQLSKAQKNVLWQFRPHLRVLHLTADSIKQLAVFRKLLREVAGSLETLTIGVRNASRRQADMDSHIVPCSLFGGRARSLKVPHDLERVRAGTDGPLPCLIASPSLGLLAWAALQSPSPPLPQRIRAHDL